MIHYDSKTEIVPGLTKEIASGGRVVIWTFAPPPLEDPGAIQLSASYLVNQLQPLGKAWAKAARETLLAWPKDQPYLAVHDFPTLADLVGASSLSKLAGLNIRSIWVDRQAAEATDLPQPSWWRLALILDPNQSARFNWGLQSSTPERNLFKLFLAEDAAMRLEAREAAVAWLEA